MAVALGTSSPDRVTLRLASGTSQEPGVDKSKGLRCRGAEKSAAREACGKLRN